MDMKCKWCQKEFIPTRIDNVYCRKKCRDRASARRTGATQRYTWKRRGIELTVDQYKEMMRRQNKKCAICKKVDDRRLAVDHDHTTGTIRGLLCKNCNRAIGYFMDDIDLVEMASVYLKSHKNKTPANKREWGGENEEKAARKLAATELSGVDGPVRC